MSRGVLDPPPEPVIGRAFARPVGGGRRRLCVEILSPSLRSVGSHEREKDRGVAETLRGEQFAPQIRRLSIGAVDADLLYQPRRKDAAENPARAAGAREGGIEASVRQGLMRASMNDDARGFATRRQKPSTRSIFLLTSSSGSIDCALRKSAIASARRPSTSLERPRLL